MLSGDRISVVGQEKEESKEMAIGQAYLVERGQIPWGRPGSSSKVFSGLQPALLRPSQTGCCRVEAELTKTVLHDVVCLKKTKTVKKYHTISLVGLVLQIQHSKKYPCMADRQVDERQYHNRHI